MSASRAGHNLFECYSSRSIRRTSPGTLRTAFHTHLPLLLSNSLIRKRKGVLCPVLHFSRNALSPTATLDWKMTSEVKGTTVETPSMKLLFVEMGVGYDQHGQDITAAAMRACRDAISSNSIPAFRSGSIPGVNSDQMKLQIKIGVPPSTQQSLDIERVKSVFPYGQILDIEVVDGGMICSSGVCLEAMGDKNDDCYIVNAAVKLELHIGSCSMYLEALQCTSGCSPFLGGPRCMQKGEHLFSAVRAE